MVPLFFLSELSKLKRAFLGVDCFFQMLTKLIIRIIFSKSTLTSIIRLSSRIFVFVFIIDNARIYHSQAAFDAIRATGAMVI